MRKTFKITLLAVFVISGPISSIHADQVEKQVLIQDPKKNEVQFSFKAQGIKKMFLHRIFSVSLYSTIPMSSDLIGTAPKHLEVKYFVSIPAEKIRAYTIKNIVRNATQSEIEAMKEGIEEMKACFVDLQPGDVYSLSYFPGQGVEFQHNGDWIGSIENEVLSKALFSIWIGEKPFDRNLRDQLLNANYAQLI